MTAVHSMSVNPPDSGARGMTAESGCDYGLRMGKSPPREKYAKQKAAARERGIPWLFTFETWLDVWSRSGKLELRGVGRGRYVMARFGDVGPYSPTNVEIVTHEQNAKDSRSNHPESSLTLSRRAIGKGKGWTLRKNGRYDVSCAKRYVGTFRTQEEAEVAYQKAIELRLMQLGAEA